MNTRIPACIRLPYLRRSKINYYLSNLKVFFKDEQLCKLRVLPKAGGSSSRLLFTAQVAIYFYIHTYSFRLIP